MIILENDCSHQDKSDNSSVSDIENLNNEINKLNLKNLRIIKLPFNNCFKSLPLETINERLLKLSINHFTPLIVSNDILNQVSKKKCNSDLLPLPIREIDFDYQCERLMIFKAILKGNFMFNEFNA